MTCLPAAWSRALAGVAANLQEVLQFVQEEREKYTVFPPQDQIFAALEMTPPEDIRVVIVGQDPYHDDHQAHGLSFSVPAGVKLPPSLRNIFKEMASDLQISPPECGDLSYWAKQGVLLLNSTLTVRAHTAGSHLVNGTVKSRTNGVIIRPPAPAVA